MQGVAILRMTNRREDVTAHLACHLLR